MLVPLTTSSQKHMCIHDENQLLKSYIKLRYPFWCVCHKVRDIVTRGGVEDTRLEAKAKAKDTKKIRGEGQGQPFRRQTLSRPRTGMLEAKAKDQGHSRKHSPKKRSSKKFFRQSPIYRRSQNF